MFLCQDTYHKSVGFIFFPSLFFQLFNKSIRSVNYWNWAARSAVDFAMTIQRSTVTLLLTVSTESRSVISNWIIWLWSTSCTRCWMNYVSLLVRNRFRIVISTTSERFVLYVWQAKGFPSKWGFSHDLTIRNHQVVFLHGLECFTQLLFSW